MNWLFNNIFNYLPDFYQDNPSLAGIPSLVQIVGSEYDYFLDKAERIPALNSLIVGAGKIPYIKDDGLGNLIDPGTGSFLGDINYDLGTLELNFQIAPAFNFLRANYSYNSGSSVFSNSEKLFSFDGESLQYTAQLSIQSILPGSFSIVFDDLFSMVAYGDAPSSFITYLTSQFDDVPDLTLSTDTLRINQEKLIPVYQIRGTLGSIDRLFAEGGVGYTFDLPRDNTFYPEISYLEFAYLSDPFYYNDASLNWTVQGDIESVWSKAYALRPAGRNMFFTTYNVLNINSCQYLVLADDNMFYMADPRPAFVDALDLMVMQDSVTLFTPSNNQFGDSISTYTQDDVMTLLNDGTNIITGGSSGGGSGGNNPVHIVK